LFTTSWLTLGWLQYSSPPGSTSVTTGVYLFGFATVALLLSTLSTLGKPYFAVLLFLAASRMLLAGLYEVGGAGSTLNEVAGGDVPRDADQLVALASHVHLPAEEVEPEEERGFRGFVVCHGRLRRLDRSWPRRRGALSSLSPASPTERHLIHPPGGVDGATSL